AWRDRRRQVALGLLHEKLRATIRRPARLGVLGARRPLLTIRHGGDALGLHAARDEVCLRGLRASLAEGEVVFGRAALVAVALDQDEQFGVCREPGRIRVEDLRVAGADVRLVEVEVNGLERGLRVVLAGRRGRLRRRCGHRGRRGRGRSRRRRDGRRGGGRGGGGGGGGGGGSRSGGRGGHGGRRRRCNGYQRTLRTPAHHENHRHTC